MRSRKSPRTLKVAILIELDSSPRRSILAGFLSHASRQGEWDVRILPQETVIDRTTIANLTRANLNGLVIDSVPDDETAELLARAPFHTISLDAPDAVKQIPRGKLSFYDNEAAENETGAFGLNKLRDSGCFRHYAFIPSPIGGSWSTNRQSGFLREAKKRGLPASVCPVDANDRNLLAQWIRRLPRPSAIMAACDRLAVQVLEACSEDRIKVPDHVCVLGVDNDTLLNEYCRPTLSSLSLDHEGLGGLIAEALNKRMRARRDTPANIRPAVDTVSFVERDSTRPPVPAAQLISKALAFINANATHGIHADDVVRHLGVSRRLAFLRFAELHGKPIATVIRERKLAEVCRKLRNTRLSLRQIASSCGFASQRPLECLFRKRFGCTMSAWRSRPHSVITR